MILTFYGECRTRLSFVVDSHTSDVRVDLSGAHLVHCKLSDDFIECRLVHTHFILISVR